MIIHVLHASLPRLVAKRVSNLSINANKWQLLRFITIEIWMWKEKSKRIHDYFVPVPCYQTSNVYASEDIIRQQIDRNRSEYVKA